MALNQILTLTARIHDESAISALEGKEFFDLVVTDFGAVAQPGQGIKVLRDRNGMPRFRVPARLGYAVHAPVRIYRPGLGRIGNELFRIEVCPSLETTMSRSGVPAFTKWHMSVPKPWLAQWSQSMIKVSFAATTMPMIESGFIRAIITKTQLPLSYMLYERKHAFATGPMHGLVERVTALGLNLKRFKFKNKNGEEFNFEST